MSKTANRVFFGVLALLAALAISFWTLLHKTLGDGAASVQWGGTNLTLSEAAYYQDRVRGVIRAWIEMGQHAAHDEEGRFKEPHHAYLVLDAAHRAIWIEDDGQVLEAYVAELPEQMTWTVHHDSGSTLAPCAEVTRLRHRGAHADRHCPELIWLAGQHGAGWHVSFCFNSDFLGEVKAFDCPFHAHRSAPPRKEGMNYYDSIIVSAAEYEESRLLGACENEAGTNKRGSPRTVLDERRARWLNVEKRLYQAIEGQVIRAGGYDSRHLTVKPGPDYSGAYAEMVMDTTSLYRRWRGGSQTAYLYATIDFLGHSVWYVRSRPDPRVYFVRTGPEPPQLEFLVSGGAPIKRADRTGWIKKGRAIADDPPPPHSQWRAPLPNGAIVELVGACETSAADKRWWGPDGSPIDYAPSFPAALHGHATTDQKIVELMWRVCRPGTTRTLSVQASSINGPPLGHRQPCARHGTELLDVYCHSFAFEKSQERSTVTLGVDVDGLGVQQVQFTNISLAPGRDFGLEIEVLR